MTEDLHALTKVELIELVEDLRGLCATCLDEDAVRAGELHALAHASDCAVHNAPAFEAGDCDCTPASESQSGSDNTVPAEAIRAEIAWWRSQGSEASDAVVRALCLLSANRLTALLAEKEERS